MRQTTTAAATTKSTVTAPPGDHAYGDMSSSSETNQKDDREDTRNFRGTVRKQGQGNTGQTMNGHGTKDLKREGA